MTTAIVRRPSPLQRRMLIVLAALDAKRPGPVTPGQAIGRSGWTTSGTWHAGAIMSSAPTEPPACNCGIRPDR